MGSGSASARPRRFAYAWPAATANRVDAIIARLRAEGRWLDPDALEAGLAHLDLPALDREELRSYYAEWARAAELRDDVSGAVARYERGLIAFPDDSALRYGLDRQRSRNRVDALLARVAREAGRYDPVRVEHALARLDRAALRAEERIAWHQAWAATATQRHDRDAALERYAHAVELHPEAGVLRFGYAQELEAKGRIDDAMSELAKAPYPAIPAEYALVGAQYAFLWGRPNDGLRLIGPVVSSVLRYGEVDEHFLRARSLPPFDQLFRFWIGLSYQADRSSLARVRSELVSLEPRLEEEGYNEILFEIDALRTGDLAALARVRREIAATLGSTTRRGACETRARIAEAWMKPRARALRALDGLSLPPLVHTALRGAFAWKAGATHDEARARLSFDPETLIALQVSDVVAYFLVAYWETLRQQYVRARAR